MLVWLGLAPADPSDVLSRVEEAAQRELGQGIELVSDYYREDGTWALICGTVLAKAAAGEALPPDVAERLQESSDFCALVDLSAGPQVIELDIGSTDMPAMDWMEKHGLPEDLLAGG